MIPNGFEELWSKILIELEIVHTGNPLFSEQIVCTVLSGKCYLWSPVIYS